MKRYLGKKRLANIERIEYKLNGESIQELTATQSETSNTLSHTRNFTIEEQVSFELPYDLKLEMKARVFGGIDTKITHYANSETRSSIPNLKNLSYVTKNPEFLDRFPILIFLLISEVFGLGHIFSLSCCRTSTV